MESATNSAMNAAKDGTPSTLPTQGVFQKLISHNLGLASMPLSGPQDNEMLPNFIGMGVPNPPCAEELSHRRSFSRASPSGNRPPAPERRYPTRNADKPRVSLREIHPDLFTDTEEEMSEDETPSTSETVLETAVASQVLQKSRISGQTATESRGSSSQTTTPPHQAFGSSAKPPHARQTGASTNASSSATPPLVSSARTVFKPPLPRPPRPPLPSARRSQSKEGLVSIPISHGSKSSSISPLSALFAPRPAHPAPSPAPQPATKRSSSQSPPLSSSKSVSPPSGNLSTSSSQPPPSSIPRVSQPAETESFETIIENYLRSQYGETKPGHGTQIEQGEAGGSRVGSQGGSAGSEADRDENTMDVHREGSSTMTARSQHSPSILTPARISETSDPIIHKRKRSPESDEGSVSQTRTPPSFDTRTGGSSGADDAGAYSSASLATKETRTSLSTPPTPISPATKRPKYSYTQHPSHWAPDGNILVQIDAVRFKLHRSRIAKHSGYFRRVLEGPVAGDGDERVIVLDETGVKVLDFEVLLDALEDFMDYFYTTPPFATAASILRASTALSFDKYTSWAQRYLTDMWPVSIDHLSATRTPHPIESLALARECGIPAIRKRVLYELVRSPKFGQQPAGPGPRLSSADLNTLSTVREELTTLWIDVTAAPSGSSLTKGLAVCGPQHTGCTTRDGARADSAHVKLVNSSGIFRDFVWDPVCGLQALAEQDWAGEGFCRGCVELRRVVWRTMREKVWVELDGLFCLTGAAANVQ